MEVTSSRNINQGFYFKGVVKKPFRSVLVVGIERSGTSMVAGVLSQLGVFMGDSCSDITYEDERLGALMKTRQKWRGVIEEYCQYPIWGFKRPSCNFLTLKRLRYFPSPLVIYIARDVVSVSTRCAQVYNRPFDQELNRVLVAQSKLTKKLASCRSPVLYLSYEKVLSKPDDFVALLCNYLDIMPTQTQLDQTYDFIQPEPESYLTVCEPHLKYVGFVDAADVKSVTGWVCTRKYGEQKPELQLFVNGLSVNFTIEIIERSDIKQQGIHPTGECGFRITPELAIKKSDHIELRVQDNGQILAFSSGFYFNEDS